MSDNVYKTKQRDEIVEFFNQHRGKCYTAKEIIKSGEITSGEATVSERSPSLLRRGC